MTFASPAWLIALLPWTGLVLWLLWGRRRRTYVSFLNLWRGPALQEPPRRGIRVPPAFLVFAIIAMLVALLGAARPQFTGGFTPSVVELSMVVDRGWTMSARTGPARRLDVAARLATASLEQTLNPSAPIDLFIVPAQADQRSAPPRTRLAELPTSVATLSSTASDSRAALVQKLHECLASARGVVVLLSDCPLDPVLAANPRIIQFAPPAEIQNVGIAALGVRALPRPQVMVRIRNDSSLTATTLSLTTGGATAAQRIDLPPSGQERNYFVDLPRLDRVVTASIGAADDQPVDNVASLAREGISARIEAHGALGAPISRMIEIFARSRPAEAGSPVAMVVTTEVDLPAAMPAIWVAPATGGPAKGAATFAASPLTADLDAAEFPVDIETAGDPPRGWTSIIAVAGHTVVAIHPGDVRQAWVGFETPATWAASPQFVIFWANLLAWMSEGEMRYIAYPLTALDDRWTPLEKPSKGQTGAMEPDPGLYRDAAGALRAFNAPVIPIQTAPSTPDWKSRLQMAIRESPRQLELAPAALLAAILGLLAAAMRVSRPSRQSST